MSTATAKRRRTGRPNGAALRWNLQQASREFGVNREALERRRRKQSIEPGEDGCFSSKQIAALLLGDDQAQAYLELTRAKAERERVSTEILLKNYVPFEEVLEVMREHHAAMRRIIVSREGQLMSIDSINDLLTELRECLTETENLGKDEHERAAA